MVSKMFGNSLETPIQVYSHSSTEAFGYFYGARGIISVNVDLAQKTLMSPMGVTDTVKILAAVIAHEMAHNRDQNLDRPSQKARTLYPGGAVHTEAKASSKKLQRLRYWFEGMVFSRDYDDNTKASELYAQLFGLYALNKELLREHLPTAYKLIQEAISEGVREDASTVVHGVSDGRADTGTDQESSTSTESGVREVQGDEAATGETSEVTSGSGKLSIFEDTHPHTEIIRSQLSQSPGRG